MTKARIPAENHEFIRRITTAVGIGDYHAKVRPETPYVIGKRRDGRPDLHIYYGYIDEQFVQVNDGFAKMRAKFDITAAGQQRIVELVRQAIDTRGGSPPA